MVDEYEGQSLRSRRSVQDDSLLNEMHAWVLYGTLLAVLRLMQGPDVCKVVTFVPFTDSRVGPPEAHTVPRIDYYPEPGRDSCEGFVVAHGCGLNGLETCQ